MIKTLAARHTELAAAAGPPDTDMTVVFDAGQNSDANFADLATTPLHYIGSVQASDCSDLLALPAKTRRPVPGYPGLTAIDTRRSVYGVTRRAILTHSDELHAAQVTGFEGTTLAKAARELDDLAATLARGHTRRTRDKVEEANRAIIKDTRVRRVLRWELTGQIPAELRLTWHIDPEARQQLEDELFGKHVLITDHDHWPVTDVIAGYRPQSEAEFSFRQLKTATSQRPPHRLVLTPVPLERAQQSRPRLHLRPGPADHPPDAPGSRPGRTAPVRPRTAGPAGQHRRNGLDLPERRQRPPQGPTHAHRNHRTAGPTHPDLRPPPVRTQALSHTLPAPTNQPPTSQNTIRKSKIIGNSG
jgi:hypothetical protein